MQKILRLYSIRDEVLSKCTPPFAVEEEIEARRIFASHVKNLDRKLYENVFSLYEVGSFDVELGNIGVNSVAMQVVRNTDEYYRSLEAAQNGAFITHD